MRESRTFWRVSIASAACMIVSAFAVGYYSLLVHGDVTEARFRDDLTFAATHTATHFERLGTVALPPTLRGRGAPAAVIALDDRGDVFYTNGTPLGTLTTATKMALDVPEFLQAASHGLGIVRRVEKGAGEVTHIAIAVRDGDQIVGYVRASAPSATVSAARAAFRNRLLITGGLSVTLLILGLTAYLRRVTVPLTDIVRAADRLAGGDPTTRLPTFESGELGNLARTLNALAEDIEERISADQLSRDQLAAVLAGLHEGVIAVDAGQHIIHINHAARRMLGITGDAQALTLWEAVRMGELQRAVDDCLEDGSPKQVQVEHDGNIFEVSVVALRDASLVGTGAIVVVQDITEVLRLERVRTEFVANASHELKTPIAAIRGVIETILDDPRMPEKTKTHFYERIRRQVLRIDNLVRELIQLSRFDSPRDGLSDLPVDLSTVVARVYQDNLDSARVRGITVRFEQVGDNPLTVDGDEESLMQMTNNLVDNAIKYSERGGEVSIRLFGEQPMAVIEIRDNGIGIAPNEHGRVFERFYRVDKARSTATGGTGLGLSIVKHVVQGHRGTVEVRSSPDAGSTFTVRLPLVTRGG